MAGYAPRAQGQRTKEGEMKPQGWYRDPFGVHENRWFSDGNPTKLVRDGAAVAYDEPPPGPLPGPLERRPSSWF
jgi:hypothetical protein